MGDAGTDLSESWGMGLTAEDGVDSEEIRANGDDNHGHCKGEELEDDIPGGQLLAGGRLEEGPSEWASSGAGRTWARRGQCRSSSRRRPFREWCAPRRRCGGWPCWVVG